MPVMFKGTQPLGLGSIAINPLRVAYIVPSSEGALVHIVGAPSVELTGKFNGIVQAFNNALAGTASNADRANLPEWDDA